MEPESLATLGRQIGQNFAKLVADTNHVQLSGSIRETLIDQMQKFRLWADNMGLCIYGHHSLDYRCRDASKVYEYVHQLLTDLEDTINLIVDEGDSMQMDAEAMSHGAEEGLEAMDLVDSDNILGGERLIDDEVPQELDEPLAKLALDNIRDTIDRLYRLSFKIRNPATRLGFSKAKRYRLLAEDGNDLRESLIAADLKHIDDLMTRHRKMPPEESRNHFLVQRLAKANTTRRQQFGLWNRHKSKVEQQIERAGGSKNITLHYDSGTTSQPIPESISQPSTATKINASICLDETQSAYTSSTITALSREDQGCKIVIPRLPEKVRGKDFECPYCYILCPGRISDGSAWRRHVFMDLRPYICTYEHCTEADQQYDCVTDWIAHEYYNHEDAMRYPGRIYSDGIPASQQDDTSRSPSLYDVCRQQCPICDKEEPSFIHVAQHLRRIAVFVLPRSAILEDEVAPGSQNSNDADLQSDEDLAEMLSESESEDTEDGVMAETMTTLSATRANLLSSNALKQLDHSRQTGPSIRDYLRNLDLDGSERDAGKRSEIILEQASVSESLAPNLDGYDPLQPPYDRIVESQPRDMIKKQNWQAILEEANQPMMTHSTTLTKSTSIGSSAFPQNLSFYVRIEPLSPDYGVHGQPIRHIEPGVWLPPNRPNGIRNGQGPILLLHWVSGSVITVPLNDPIRGSNFDGYVYSAATIFAADTPHLFTVPFNARTRSVHPTFGRGWQVIRFNHSRVGNYNSYFSYISHRGAEQRIAAPRLPDWIPQLLPTQYDCDPRHATRVHAGLIGELPLLIGLAAFSAPPQNLGMLSSTMQPGKWISHSLTTGRIAERGMVVTVYTDPRNPHWSTPQLLDRLQNGEYGPFYGP